MFRKEFVSSFIEGRSRRTSENYDELALIFEVPTSYIGREVSKVEDACPRHNTYSLHVVTAKALAKRSEILVQHHIRHA